MKPSILLLALSTVIAFGSCTTAYKTGQTPDDVYYSPATPKDEYVRVDRKEDRQYRGSEDFYDDRYLRMKVQNRNRWSDLDDWYYYGNRYNYSYYNYNYWNNPWTPYTYWNYTCNPYYNHGVILSPKSLSYNAPRTYNLNTYNGTNITSNNYSTPKTAGGRPYTGSSIYNNTSNSYNNTETRRDGNTGNFLRNVFNNNNSSSNNSNNSSNNSSTPRSSSSSSSSSSSGSSSSGSTAPVRKF